MNIHELLRKTEGPRPLCGVRNTADLGYWHPPTTDPRIVDSHPLHAILCPPLDGYSANSKNVISTMNPRVVHRGHIHRSILGDPYLCFHCYPFFLVVIKRDHLPCCHSKSDRVGFVCSLLLFLVNPSRLPILIFFLTLEAYCPSRIV